jgi:hypothetical protein
MILHDLIADAAAKSSQSAVAPLARIHFFF